MMEDDGLPRMNLMDCDGLWRVVMDDDFVLLADDGTNADHDG